MKKGAILVSSIELADEILNSNTRAKYRINNYFKKNKFAGAKDKKKITDLVFKFLKNYFSQQALQSDSPCTIIYLRFHL